MDHVCYRCATPDEYAAVCDALAGQGHACLTEAPVGGRLVATFELATPLQAAGFTVRCLEVGARARKRVCF
jgi:predicted metalloenzyme YecM